MRLQELREKHGLTKKEFANRCTIRRSTMANYLDGRVSPTLDRIEQIAEEFNVSPAWLAGWDEPKEKINEKVVYVQDLNARIPSDWQNDETGKLIKWKERKRY